MIKMQYTEEQITKTNQINLVLLFLNAQRGTVGEKWQEYHRWKKHDSVVSGNQWYQHSRRGRGGYPLDL